jgi:hypothetical protein
MKNNPQIKNSKKNTSTVNTQSLRKRRSGDGVALKQAEFDLQDSDLPVTFSTGLSKGFAHAVTLNSYPNGISVTMHRPFDSKSASTYSTAQGVLAFESRGVVDPFFLRTKETRDVLVPEGKFLVYRDGIKTQLENIFSSLSKKKVLSDTVVYLGTFTDPFHGFHKKFSQTMACIEILERYVPGRLVIQSRSRMLLTALPTLKAMKDTAFCVIPFESRLEGSILRYTPGQPRLEERLVTAAGLRAQGISVTFSVCPVLPYGDTSGDAWKFGEVLVSYSDRVLLQALYRGDKQEESLLRQLQLTKKLESDDQLKILRPNADDEIRGIIQRVSPEHLQLPDFHRRDPDQLKLFAA